MDSNNQPQTNNTQMSQQQNHIELPQIQQTKQYKSTAQQTKKAASYTYWVDQKNKSRQLPPEQRPQKIQPPKVNNQKTQDGRSHWNTAGIWEPKNISLKEIEKQYTQKINEWIKINAPQTQIKKVTLNGECQIVFIRTKKALTYDINGKVQFEKGGKKEESEKKIQTEVQNDSGSDSLSLSDDRSDNSQNSPRPKKSGKNSQSMTFQIVDLTDHGDREFKSKADQAEDKKWIGSKSQELLVILETILKSYK